MQREEKSLSDKKEILREVARYVKDISYDESSGHDWWHIKRVFDLSYKLNKKEEKDSFVIGMIALLHDMYDDKFSNERPRVALTELLNTLNVYDGIDSDTLENILGSIENLGFKGGINSISISEEGQIVQDADRLDSIGAIGIARVFAYGGKVGRPIYNPDQGIIDIKSEEEYRNMKRHSLNHFYEKLLRIKDTMNTEEGKKEAIRRTKFMEEYLAEFFDEWNISSKDKDDITVDVEDKEEEK